MEHLPYPKIPSKLSNAPSAGPWIATEKIHGAQLVVAYDGRTLRIGKRKAWLRDDEAFFGWQLLRGALLRTARSAVDHFGAAAVRLYGELYGGHYPHPSVTPIPGASPVQTGIWYSPDIRFALFDVLVTAADSTAGPRTEPDTGPSTDRTAGPSANPSTGRTAGRTISPSALTSADPSAGRTAGPSTGPGADPTTGRTTGPSAGTSAGTSAEGRAGGRVNVVATYADVVAIAAAGGVDAVPLLARGPRTVVDAVPYRFASRVPAALGLPALAGNLAEGVVLRPDARLPLLERPIVKRKIPEFDEARFGEAQPWDPHISPADVGALAATLVNPPRVASARSKVGPDDAEALEDEVVLDVMIDLSDAFPMLQSRPELEEQVRAAARRALAAVARFRDSTAPPRP